MSRSGAVVLILSVIALSIGAIQMRITEQLEVGTPAPSVCGGLTRGTTGIVRLQFARTVTCADALVSNWRAQHVSDAAKRVVGIDFGFLVAYGLALVVLSLWVRSTETSPRWRKALTVAASGAAVAAAFDFVENLGLLRMLGVLGAGPEPALTFWIAAGKFIVLGSVLLVVSIAWIGTESRGAAFLSAPVAAPGAPATVSAGAAALYLWPLRVPIAAGVFLVGFPLLLRNHAARRFVSGFFDPIEEAAVLPIVLLALLCAWTIAITGRLVLAYGHDRLALPPLGGRSLAYVPGSVWAYSAALAVPMPWTVIAQSHAASDASIAAMLLYALLGTASACLLLAVTLRLGRWAAHRAKPGGFQLYRRVIAYLATRPSLADGFIAGNPPVLRPGHGIAACLALASLATYATVGYWTRDVDRPLFASTLAYVLTLTVTLAWLYGFLAFLLDRTRIPILIWIFAWMLFLHFGLDRIVSTDIEYETYVLQTRQSAVPPGPTLTAGTTRPVVVAASGGGIQAAAWTAQVLIGLANDSAEFEPAVRLLSGVSGGSVGVMHFLTQDAGCGVDDAGVPPTSRDAALQHAMESSLHAVGWGLVYQDLPRTVAPLPYITSPLVNRGQLLEDAWKRDPRLGVRIDPKQPDGSPALLSTWARNVTSGACPGVVFNAMVAETGEPMLFSTASLPPSLARFAFGRHYGGLDSQADHGSTPVGGLPLRLAGEPRAARFRPEVRAHADRRGASPALQPHRRWRVLRQLRRGHRRRVAARRAARVGTRRQAAARRAVARDLRRGHVQQHQPRRRARHRRTAPLVALSVVRAADRALPDARRRATRAQPMARVAARAAVGGQGGDRERALCVSAGGWADVLAPLRLREARDRRGMVPRQDQAAARDGCAVRRQRGVFGQRGLPLRQQVAVKVGIRTSEVGGGGPT